MADIQWGRLSALIVDDERYMRGIASRVLTDIGFGAVLEAADGAEGLKIVNGEERVDVVVLDLDMPVVDGFEFLKTIRQDKQWKELPVVIMSGHSEMDNVIRAAEIGVHGFTVKPVSLAILKKQLTRALTAGPIDPEIFRQ